MNLTMKRLRAIEEALIARTAGELGDDAADREDYETALEWVEQEIERRKAARRLADAAR